MKWNNFIGFVTLLFLLLNNCCFADIDVTFNNKISLKGTSHKITISGDELVQLDSLKATSAKETTLLKNPSRLNTLYLETSESGVLEIQVFAHQDKKQVAETFVYKIKSMPSWLSILPPLLAIFLAILTKEVISSLFIGILSGSVLVAYYGIEQKHIASAFFMSVSDYLIPALNDSGHLSVIVFSMLIGATVAVISKNGGMKGMVNRIAKKAKTAKQGQMATYFLGLLIFFDDYANTLVIGNTMRPVCDKLKISREKLAYLVDSTAAPVASIAFVTTWIGAQLDYISDGIESISAIQESAYAVFLHAVPYSFYPIFTIVFMFLLIVKQRDFGPMLQFEKAARRNEQLQEEDANQSMKDLEPDERIKPKTYNALIPIIALVAVTFGSLIYTGFDAQEWYKSEDSFLQKAGAVLGRADSYAALLWGSLTSLCLAVLLTVSQRIMRLHQNIDVIFKGFGFMLPAVLILCLAWSLSDLTKDLQTAQFIASSLSSLNLQAFLLPAITFLMASLVSFSTGSSWSTMAILYPIMLPAVWALCMENGMDTALALPIFYQTVSSVLAGSVLGDHSSPISDTTVLSSLASSCNHINHVKSQLPYALTVGLVSLLIGTVPAALGLPIWVCYAAGTGVLYLIILKAGKIV
jgi:Na+/H+ antiporter NhaC